MEGDGILLGQAKRKFRNGGVEPVLLLKVFCVAGPVLPHPPNFLASGMSGMPGAQRPLRPRNGQTPPFLRIAMDG